MEFLAKLSLVVVSFSAPVSARYVSTAIFGSNIPSYLQDSRDAITCTGRVPEKFLQLSRVTLADFCVDDTTEAVCGWEYEPPGLLFHSLDEDGSDLSLGQTPTLANDDAELRRELCRTKCSCSHSASYLRGAHSFPSSIQSFPSNIRQDRVGLEWNFDTDTAVTRVIEPQEKYWVKAFDKEHTIAVVGNPDNAPVCDDDPVNLSDGFVERIRSSMPAGWTGYSSYQDLCVHRYYGGNDMHSLGAVCVAQEPNLWFPRELEFPYEYRSPFFSSDGVGRTSFAFSLSPGLIKAICESHCQCEGPEKSQSNSPISKWNKLATRPEIGDSDSDDSSSHGFSGASGYDESLPKAFQDRLPNVKTKSLGQSTCSAGECHGSSDCGSECRCTVYGFQVDPVNFQPLGHAVLRCAAAAIMLIPQVRKHTRKKIGGRGIESLYQAHLCACNATYISAGCCGSPDGLVWEDPGLKIGELRKRVSELSSEVNTYDIV